MKGKSQWSMVNKSVVCAFFFLSFIFCHLSSFSQSSPKYEFRAAWIATIANIDWPSQKGLSSDVQKTEFINILDRLQRDGMNAVIVQVRPNADAFYASKMEPWSEYLSGTQGVAPSPYYDPLQFMIEETHKRGMEFHAWINPYRAVFNLKTNSIAPNSITKTHPEWFVTYGNTKYFNPGLPEVKLYLQGIVGDIVTRYDIDGLHMDDYFYPYKIAGKEFADNASYLRYGNGLSKEDWRRSNCDSIVKYIHDIVLATKPMCKFGISPFGVWQNKKDDADGSNTHAAVDDYNVLYADVLLWMKLGWIDYVAPQVYWEIGNNLCDYKTLVDWWAAHSYGKQVYIGHALYKVFDPDYKRYWSSPDELPNQIFYLRGNENVQGSIFFSTNDLLRDPNGWEDSLQNNYYKSPALIPPMAWIDTTPPKSPQIMKVKYEKDMSDSSFKFEVRITPDENETIKNYAVYFSANLATLGDHPSSVIPSKNEKNFSININTAQIPVEGNHCFAAITCVDRENNESTFSNVIQFEKTNNGWKIVK